MPKENKFQVPSTLGIIGACIVLLNSFGTMGLGMFMNYTPMMQFAFRGFNGLYIGLGVLSLIAGILMIISSVKLKDGEKNWSIVLLITSGIVFLGGGLSFVGGMLGVIGGILALTKK